MVYKYYTFRAKVSGYHLTKWLTSQKYEEEYERLKTFQNISFDSNAFTPKHDRSSNLWHSHLWHTDWTCSNTLMFLSIVYDDLTFTLHVHGLPKSLMSCLCTRVNLHVCLHFNVLSWNLFVCLCEMWYGSYCWYYFVWSCIEMSWVLMSVVGGDRGGGICEIRWGVCQGPSRQPA